MPRHVFHATCSILLTAALAACKSGSASKETTCNPAPDHSVIACVNGARVTRDEVVAQLRDLMPVPGTATLPDPRPPALERAIRVHLFAGEAERRKLKIRGNRHGAARRILLHRALIRGVVGPRSARANISDAEARAYFDKHRPELLRASDWRLRAIFVKDAARATQLYRQLKGASDEQFAAAARKWSQDVSAEAGGDLPLIPKVQVGEYFLDKILHSELRKPGDLVGPIPLPDGRFIVARARSVALADTPFEAQRVRVINRMTRERRQAILDKLYAELRAKAKITVFKDELALAPKVRRSPETGPPSRKSPPSTGAGKQ